MDSKTNLKTFIYIKCDSFRFYLFIKRSIVLIFFGYFDCFAILASMFVCTHEFILFLLIFSNNVGDVHHYLPDSLLAKLYDFVPFICNIEAHVC